MEFFRAFLGIALVKKRQNLIIIYLIWGNKKKHKSSKTNVNIYSFLPKSWIINLLK